MALPLQAGWVIQRGGPAWLTGKPRQFHTLDQIVRPWTMSPELALRFARMGDAEDYQRAHLAAGHSVVSLEAALAR